MRGIFFLLVILFTFSSCSKENTNPDKNSSGRVTYTFSPGIGGSANISLYSNREGRYINTNASSLYSYQDEVKPGDKITLVMKKDGEIRGNFDIRVSMDGKIIFSSSTIESGSFPSTIVIDKVIDKSYF